MARAIEYTTTNSSIKVRVTGLDTSYNASNRYIDWWLYDEYGDEVDSELGKSVSANASSTSYVTFSGLDADTKYEVVYELFYSSTESGEVDASAVGSEIIWTDEKEIDIAHFSWTTAKTSGGSFNVTAAEWNRLINKVIEVYDARGGYDTVDTRYPMTKVSSGDVFTAERFNEVRYAIGSLYSTGISEKNAGDIIYASDLNQLATSINKAIDNL